MADGLARPFGSTLGSCALLTPDLRTDPRSPYNANANAVDVLDLSYASLGGFFWFKKQFPHGACGGDFAESFAGSVIEHGSDLEQAPG